MHNRASLRGSAPKNLPDGARPHLAEPATRRRRGAPGSIRVSGPLDGHGAPEEKEQGSGRRLMAGHKQAPRSPPPGPGSACRWGPALGSLTPPAAAAAALPPFPVGLPRSAPPVVTRLPGSGLLSSHLREGGGGEGGSAQPPFFSPDPHHLQQPRREAVWPRRAGSQPRPAPARLPLPHPATPLLPFPEPARSPPPRLPTSPPALSLALARTRAPRLRACSITVPRADRLTSPAPPLFEYSNEGAAFSL